VEDAPAGVQAALAAGMRVVGLTTTHPAEELAAATLVASWAEVDLSAATLAGGAPAPPMTD